MPYERKGRQATIIQRIISFNLEAFRLCVGLDRQENVSECEYELCSF